MKRPTMVFLCLVFIFGMIPGLGAQNFTRVDAGFPVSHYPANALVDLDNDGDLDAFIAGTDELDVPLAEVYINSSGTFTLASSLEGVYDAYCSVGDFNNDGLADLAVCGMNTSSPSTKIYRNDGDGSFTDIGASVTGLRGGAIAWGDYNNDGWTDLLLCGADASGTPMTLLYNNNGDGSFESSGISFTGLSGGEVAWSDIDVDGDLDFAVCGKNTSGSPETLIYLNNNGSFNLMGAGIEGLLASTVSWGDYNNDSYPDLLLTGVTTSNITVTAVYKNNGGGSFSAITANFDGVAFGSGLWGDFDNDGNLDIVVGGQEVEESGGGGPPLPGQPAELALYLNLGNEQFQKHQLIPAGVEDNAVSCGDYDNDSDLDLLVSGRMINAIGVITENTAIYRNETTITNNPPSTPDGLTVNLEDTELFLDWNAATDDKTPSDGLNYNIRIGTQEDNMDGFSALADLDNGYRRLAAIGNTSSNTSWNINSLAFGEYYVSVQAIDPSYAGSGFSEDIHLEVIPTADFTAEDSVCVNEETNIIYTGNASSEAQYDWNFDGAAIVSGSGQGPYTLYWASEGLKTLSLIVTENGVISEPVSHEVMVVAYPATPGFIAGPPQICQGTSSTEFYVPPISGALEYEWSLNPPEAGIITGTNINGTAHWDPDFHGEAYIFVRGMNYCGYGPYSDSLEVTINPLPEKPEIPEGPTALCQGSLNTSYQTGSIAFADGYQWDLFPLSAGFIYGTGQQVEINWSASYTGEARLIVAGYNSCGEGPVSDSLHILVEAPPDVYAGENQLITYGGTAQLSGSASGGSGDYSYSWIPDSLLLDPHSASTTTVPLEQSVQFVLFVTDNAIECVGSDAMVVTVTGGPLMVEALADPEEVCEGDEVNLLALASGGSGSYTYTWTSDPPGFTSSEAAPVDYPEVSTTYYVLVTDSGDEVSDSILVNVNPIPGQAGPVNGPENVCAGDENILFEIEPVPYANIYLWELDEGIFGSSDSLSILLTFAEEWTSGGGNIRVTPVNSCGLGEESVRYVNVWDAPGRPEMVSGTDTLCTTTDTISEYILQSPVINALDYEWGLLPDEAGQIISDGLTASVHWEKNWEGDVLISIRAINDCGQSIWSEPLQVWAFNCLGISDVDNENIELQIYPNPADEVLGVRCNVLGEILHLELHLYDLFGRKVIETSHPGRGLIEINTSGIPAGMYILSLRSENGLNVSKRVVIQH